MCIFEVNSCYVLKACGRSPTQKIGVSYNYLRLWQPHHRAVKTAVQTIKYLPVAVLLRHKCPAAKGWQTCDRSRCFESFKEILTKDYDMCISTRFDSRSSLQGKA